MIPCLIYVQQPKAFKTYNIKIYGIYSNDNTKI